MNRTLYRRVSDAIGIEGQKAIDALLAEPGSESRKTRWDALKQDARSPTLTHVRGCSSSGTMLHGRAHILAPRLISICVCLFPEPRPHAERVCADAKPVCWNKAKL
jgi:hypothetical protein